MGKDLTSKIEVTPNPILLTGEYNLNPGNRRSNFRSIVVQDIRDTILLVRQKTKSLGSDPGRGYSYIFLYRDVPLNRASFSEFRLQDRVSFF